MTAVTTIAGSAGGAIQVDTGLAPGTAWVVELHRPVFVQGNPPALLSQFAVAVAPVPAGEDESGPVCMYSLALAPLERPWAGGSSIAISNRSLSVVYFMPGDDAMARQVARAVAGSLAAGLISPGGRHVNLALHAAVRVLTFALYQQGAGASLPT